MKAQLRKEVIQKMKEIKGREKEEADASLTQRLLSSKAYQEASTIASYLSMKHEFQTQVFIDQALADGKRLLIPKTYPQGRMIFVEYREEDLRPTSFGLMEPQSEVAVPKEEIDLIHVPGVVFNSDGYRIGYGAGYYDRYLADYQGETISTIYACQCHEFEPDAHDIPVQKVEIYES